MKRNKPQHRKRATAISMKMHLFGFWIMVLSVSGCAIKHQKRVTDFSASIWRTQVSALLQEEVKIAICPYKISRDSVFAYHHQRFISQIPIEKEWAAIAPVIRKSGRNAVFLLVNERGANTYDTLSGVQDPISAYCSLYVYDKGNAEYYKINLTNFACNKEKSKFIEDDQISYWWTKKCFSAQYTSFCEDYTAVYNSFDKKGRILRTRVLIGYCK